MIEDTTSGAGRQLRALAERMGELRAEASGLAPDADWEDAAARGFAERAAGVLGALAVLEASAAMLAEGVR
ncbi:hypothetical protein [Rathayibacter sp. VKM Ac-2630]|uniref:hypothetical protein n=1 Tax=Rathayibacter sp. VKM Ac-2630 TaxID=1938617 RepID=UPI000980E8E0|nr:hypothetical protein [Rathayibacter sp. VKM Ac-2630]OOB89787.1 hypothetical protein B0T42_15520 [Rathayibacter sp. VKM Ac-2630]